jgi:hypothetical protein
MAHAQASGVKTITWDEVPERSFDFINAEQIFEHIPQPLETLRYLATALKKTGAIRISVPSARGIERRLETMNWDAPRRSRDSLMPVAPLEHINCFRRTSLRHMADRAGLEELILPLGIQFGHRTDWDSPMRVAKNFARPILRSIVRRDDCIYLRHTCRG